MQDIDLQEGRLSNMVMSLVALVGIATSSGPRQTNPFVLVENGAPKATILLPLRATVADRRAAQILQSSVQSMTGGLLPIRFVRAPDEGHNFIIGFKNRPVTRLLRPDGFSINVNADRVNIVSGGMKGSIYAVVDILEKAFGCRCFSPTAYLFPKRSNLKLVAQAYSNSPVNTFRAVNGDFSLNQDWLDWQRLSNTSDLFGNGYYVHTFAKLVPPTTYFKAHPDYFALVNGKRDVAQLCPSRAETVQIAVQTLTHAMAEDPEKQIWSVSQNDNGSYCQCPDCLKAIQEEGSPSGPILRFVNAVAKHFPDKTISTLAYEYSRSAPKLTVPASNVQIMLCTIEMNRSRPIVSDPTSASFVKDIVDWGRICHKIYLWDYTVDFTHQIAPFPNLHVLKPNIDFFVKNNARWHFQQTNTSPGHEFSELKSYVIAKLLWNPATNVDQVIAEFLSGYYGNAAPFLRRYIAELTDNLVKSGTRLDIFGSPVAHKSDFLSGPAMARYNRLFDQAEAATEGNIVLLQRVKTARLSLDYAALSIAADDAFGPRGFFENVNGQPLMRKNVTKTIREFEVTSALNQVRSVNEANVTPQEYATSVRRMLKLETVGNHAFRKKIYSIPAPSKKYAHGDDQELTNGIHGSNDFNTQWVGWEGTDFNLIVDLGKSTRSSQTSLDAINVWHSWILYPKSISCSISIDGQHYRSVGYQSVSAIQQRTAGIKHFKYQWHPTAVRYVRFQIKGTLQLPDWHTSAGGKSWVFLDEIVVR